MLIEVKQLIKFLTLECLKFSFCLKLIEIGNYSQTHFIVIKGDNILDLLVSHHQACTVS
jgi:hypothetical protein